MTNAITDKTMKWLDFTPHGFHLVPSKLPSGLTVLVMVGKIESNFQRDGLAKLGFKEVGKNTFYSNRYTRDGGKISGLRPSMFTEFWPNMVVRQMTYDEVYRPWLAQNATQVKETESASSNSLQTESGMPVTDPVPTAVLQNPPERIVSKSDITPLTQATFLGLNEFNESVYLGVDGRFAQNESGTVSGEDLINSNPSRLLKVCDLVLFNSTSKLEGINSCAKGIVNELVEGKSLSYSDLKQKAAIWFDAPIEKIESRQDKGIPIFLSIQRAVEGSIASEVRNLISSQEVRDSNYAASKYLALYSRRPVVPRSEIIGLANSSNSLISSDLPPSISKMIGDFTSSLPDEPTITIPFASTGAALTFLRDDARVNVVSQDREVGLSKFGIPEYLTGKNIRFMDGDLFNGAIDSRSTDCLIFVAPSGLLKGPINIDTLSVDRYEHQLAVSLLRSMKDTGKALLVLQADGVSNMGSVNRESFPFHSYIHQHYNVSAFIDIDSSVTNTSSTEALRAYVISGRKPIPEFDIEIPQTCDILYSHEQISNWSEKLADPTFTYVKPTALSITVIDEEIRINEYQAKYVPVCELGEATSMIPKNLALATRQGFIKFLTKHPNLTEFVSDRLQMGVDELSVFEPEQIDAIALAIWSNESNLGFLNGDDTGEGKGRVQAALMRYHVLNGRKAVFLTSSHALFSDIWRDIVAIKSEDLFKPLLMNDNSTILDDQGNILFTADPKKTERLVNSNGIPDENIIMGTYSQISRATEYEHGTNKPIPNKAAWLTNLATGNFISLDESHLAAGTSNTNVKVERILSASAYCMYSSGTWAKTEKNFSVYSKLLRGIEPSTITKAIDKGGDALLEIFAASLAADGRFIRREKDISNLHIETVIDSEKLPRNILLNNSFARVMQGMSVLTGNLDRVINKSNEELAKKLEANLPQNSKRTIKTRDIGLNTTGFSSQLSNLSKQFLLAVNCESSAEIALEEIRANRKPFLVMEFTGNTFIQSMYDKRAEQIKNGQATDFVFKGELQFRDLIHSVLDRSLCINPRKSQAPSMTYEQILSGQELADFKDSLKSLREEIDNMPELAFMPIDSIRHKIESADITFAELTSRTLRIDKIDENTYEFVKFKRSKSDIKDKTNLFNNGGIDALLGTKPACAGISIHASKTFNDQRQRTMIEVEVFRNISDRIQILGRTNRRGQVIAPRILSVGSGLPAQERFNAMSNAALMRMSANVTSNRNSAMYLDTTNLLNSEGDLICQKYLEVNPDYIFKLGLNHEDVYVKNITKSSIESLSRKVTGRLSLLEFDEQEKVYNELSSEYNIRIQDLNNRGINPFNPRHLDIKATETGRQLYKGTEKTFYNSVFDEPIKLVEITYPEKIKPWNTDHILDAIDKNSSWLSKDSRLKDSRLLGAPSLKPIAEIILAKQDALLLGAADGDSSYLKAVETDLSNRRASKAAGLDYTPMKTTLLTESIINMIVRLEYLRDTLPKIQLGTILTMPNNFYLDFHLQGDCVVTGIRLPQHGSEHNPSQYVLEVIAPGESESMQISLDQFFNSRDLELIKAATFSESHSLAAEFDSHQEGVVFRDAITLEGNMFLAALECADQGLGVPVTYTTDAGESRRAIMLRHDLNVEAMIYRPVTIHSSKMAADYLRTNPSHYISNTEKRSDVGSLAIQMSQSKDRYILTLPSTVKASRQFVMDEPLKQILNNRPIEEARSYKTMDIFENELDAVVSRLYKLGVSFITKPKGLEWINRYEANQINVASPLSNQAVHTSHSFNKI